ncbi:MAG: hypothetical protein AAF563_12315 [Pseudomonadota bacterium]
MRLACLEIASDNATRASLQDADKLLAMAERYVDFVAGTANKKPVKAATKKSG